MAATEATAIAVTESILADLAAYFGVDACFLRHNDHDIGATRLVAQWPARAFIPSPDPIGVVHFDGADPVFAKAEHLKEPTVLRPGLADGAYRELLEKATGNSDFTLAAAPLLSGPVTTGTLGFVSFGEREWSTADLDALAAIASLFAQSLARFDAEAQLRFAAGHDDLTGLNNRRSLMAHLDDRLAEGRPGPVAALFLDLDRLTMVNAYLGTIAGDQYIRGFADQLRQRVGDAMIARLGGDEFVVIPNEPMDIVAAAELAAELQDGLRQEAAGHREALARTVSIGVAAAYPGRDTTSDLLNRADHAVLKAKAAGGNQLATFTYDEGLKAAFREEVEMHLGGAAEADAFVLHFQPEVDLRTGRILAVEGLVRWQHPTRGLLLPDSFIGVAESMNLAGELGRWVLRAGCAQLAQWRRAGLAADLVLRVNVSPVQLVTDGFADDVAAVLAATGVSGDTLCLEITESVLVRDIDTARATLLALKELGARVAIDDFGTGYSVLSYLKSLPVDTLKVDRSFVRDLGHSARDLAIVRAIIALARSFDLDVVAEGVETPEAAATLLEHGCHRAQGFLLARPLPADEMTELLRRGKLSWRSAGEGAAPQQ
ncbi:bifunctional diguanylate cyclase/phosphodiesterase [Mycobacterium sp. MYCO198283]|uniref:putative bifunctional diguanylate cyclase/phosphodiesterase n=1 Tax=Mycobacterium sp. MYCO198283 TaxID=2883505 RepID=UPI001E583AD1|nr:bifunctional diguanylate cyclase/phosphodiesterase [Mycobacterium sp. MYCO198283]MCG5430801.1 bifunctional diguanylate cyclase/phosphodiesterase [Mycobacterium sp. MYCO198283]